MIAGYVRLSRDDDRQHYSSIENQKLIILQFAQANGLTIDCWFEDDGISGYHFNRPQFQEMMCFLSEKKGDHTIDTIIIKDFSRLGRHNAKVLLLLDELKEKGCRLIAVDDNYDSFDTDDDIIGIKTWYNERYIKDTSKKIRRVLHAKQKEGTLLAQVPFGYKRNEQNRQIIEIIPEEAKIVTMIYELYQQGLGYRKLADFLNNCGTPTPSLMRYGYDCLANKSSKRHIALQWSDSMVKDILDNDFYTGIYRLHKRARRMIHGTDFRIPKNDQCIFPNHHPAIISPGCFKKIQQLKKERMQKRTNTATASLYASHSSSAPFSHLLICKDCGHRMIPIIRKNKNSVRKYYICSTYNRKGKRFCSSSHLIEEWVIWESVRYFIRFCSDLFAKELSSCNFKTRFPQTVTEPRCLSDFSIDKAHHQLQTLLEQKIRDLSNNPERSEFLRSAYDSLEKQLLSHIMELEAANTPSPTTSSQTQSIARENDGILSADKILETILTNENLTPQDLDLLIQSISVSSTGMVEIHLRCFIPPALLPLHNALAGRRYARDGV